MGDHLPYTLRQRTGFDTGCSVIRGQLVYLQVFRPEEVLKRTGVLGSGLEQCLLLFSGHGRKAFAACLGDRFVKLVVLKYVETNPMVNMS